MEDKKYYYLEFWVDKDNIRRDIFFGNYNIISSRIEGDVALSTDDYFYYHYPNSRELTIPGFDTIKEFLENKDQSSSS